MLLGHCGGGIAEKLNAKRHGDENNDRREKRLPHKSPKLRDLRNRSSKTYSRSPIPRCNYLSDGWLGRTADVNHPQVAILETRAVSPAEASSLSVLESQTNINSQPGPRERGRPRREGKNLSRKNIGRRTSPSAEHSFPPRDLIRTHSGELCFKQVLFIEEVIATLIASTQRVIGTPANRIEALLK